MESWSIEWKPVVSDWFCLLLRSHFGRRFCQPLSAPICSPFMRHHHLRQSHHAMHLNHSQTSHPSYHQSRLERRDASCSKPWSQHKAASRNCQNGTKACNHAHSPASFSFACPCFSRGLRPGDQHQRPKCKDFLSATHQHSILHCRSRASKPATSRVSTWSSQISQSSWLPADAAGASAKTFKFDSFAKSLRSHSHRQSEMLKLFAAGQHQIQLLFLHIHGCPIFEALGSCGQCAGSEGLPELPAAIIAVQGHERRHLDNGRSCQHPVHPNLPGLILPSSHTLDLAKVPNGGNSCTPRPQRQWSQLADIWTDCFMKPWPKTVTCGRNGWTGCISVSILRALAKQLSFNLPTCTKGSSSMCTALPIDTRTPSCLVKSQPLQVNHQGGLQSGTFMYIPSVPLIPSAFAKLSVADTARPSKWNDFDWPTAPPTLLAVCQKSWTRNAVRSHTASHPEHAAMRSLCMVTQWRIEIGRSLVERLQKCPTAPHPNWARHALFEAEPPLNCRHLPPLASITKWHPPHCSHLASRWQLSTIFHQPRCALLGWPSVYQSPWDMTWQTHAALQGQMFEPRRWGQQKSTKRQSHQNHRFKKNNYESINRGIPWHSSSNK